jgi:hypothetical protein
MFYRGLDKVGSEFSQWGNIQGMLGPSRGKVRDYSAQGCLTNGGVSFSTMAMEYES